MKRPGHRYDTSGKRGLAQPGQRSALCCTAAASSGYTQILWHAQMDGFKPKDFISHWSLTTSSPWKHLAFPITWETIMYLLHNRIRHHVRTCSKYIPPYVKKLENFERLYIIGWNRMVWFSPKRIIQTPIYIRRINGMFISPEATTPSDSRDFRHSRAASHNLRIPF